MNKSLPDKWVRKAIYGLLNDTVLGGQTIKCFDSRVKASASTNNYYLMSIQNADVDNATKCDANWISTIRLECVSIYQSTGNTGSRVFCDNLADNMRDQLQNTITLDPASNLTVNWQKLSQFTDLVTPTKTQIIYRKIAVLELYIE